MARRRKIFGPNLSWVLERAPAAMCGELLAAMKGPDGPIVDLSATMPVHDRSVLLDHLKRLDPDVLKQMEDVARQIIDLSDGKGVTSLETVVNRRLLNSDITEFEQQPDELCRAIWVFVNHSGVFEDARSFHIARRYRDHGKLYSAFEIADDVPRVLNADQIDLGVFCERVQQTLDLKAKTTATAIDLPQTKPHPASVMVVIRHGGALSSVQDHRDDGFRKTLYFRPANEAILIYTPSLKRLEVCATAYNVREKTSRAFAEAALGQDLSKKPLARWDYSLERFKTSLFLPLPDFDDVEVFSAKVTALEMRLGSWQRRILLEVTADDDMETFASRFLGPAMKAARIHGYSRISITVKFKRRNEETSETLVLWINSNNMSNVQNARDPDLRDLGIRLLASWNIMEEQRLLGREETARYFENLLFLYEYPEDEIEGLTLREAGIDIARLKSAQLLAKKSRQQIVLIEDDAVVSERELKTSDEPGVLAVEGPFGQGQGFVAEADYTVFKINREYLAELVLDALRYELGAGSAATETDCIASFGAVAIGEKMVPVYLVRTLSTHQKPELIDLEFRRRHEAGPGIVLATGNVEVPYLGPNVVVPLARITLAGDEAIELNPDALEEAWRAGQSMVMASEKAQLIRHRTQFATLRVPGQPPLNLFGDQQAILFERLIAEAHAGRHDVRTGELMRDMSSTSPSQLFSVSLWRTIVDRYLTQARPKTWRLGPSNAS